MALTPQLWTASGLAVELRLSPRQMGKILEGVEPIQTKGRRKYFRMRQAVDALQGREARGLDLTEQRARQHKESADRLAMENAQRRGELVDAIEIGALWQDLAIEVRQRIMMIPSRCAPQVAKLRTVPSVRKAIEAECRSALESLSDSRAQVS